MPKASVVCKPSRSDTLARAHCFNLTQTTNNACATVALLNIVMNVPDIHLGDHLSAFKTYTQGLKPAYRGQSLGCNDFIRGVHNTFVRWVTRRYFHRLSTDE